MPLTTLLMEKEVKDLFRRAFVFEPFDIDAELKAAPITKNFSKIGTAFDYLARFWLKHRHPHAEERRWVAENAVDLFGDEAFEVGMSIITRARRAYHAYLQTGAMTDDLLRHAMRLSGLDLHYRAGRNQYAEDEINEADVEDLRNIWGVLECGDLTNLEGPVYLNPTFDDASRMVGGANADIIANDILFDIKTTKTSRFTREHFNQIAGYVVLNYMDKGRGFFGGLLGRGRLKQFGVYFSRHGVLRTLPGELIHGAPGFSEFVSEFEALAEKYHRPSELSIGRLTY